MKNYFSKLSFNTKISFGIILLMMIFPIVLVISGVDLLRELKILFWILLFVNFAFVIVVSISKLTKNMLVQKLYSRIFNDLYDANTEINAYNNLVFIDSVIGFLKSEKENIDFKKDKVRLREIIDSSSETHAFPILTISFTIMYTISIYNNNIDIRLINLKGDIVIMILDLVLIFTFVYVFTLTYSQIRSSLCRLCLDIIEEYELDK